MYSIKTYNTIAPIGLDLLKNDHYQINTGIPDAILLRSHLLQQEEIAPSIKAIARAGAGVNNIPVPLATERGIPVFNTPGANANAVKELVLCGLLLASRHICQAFTKVKTLAMQENSTNEVFTSEIENIKKEFKGIELAGRTLGVIGLGAIGVKVANTAVHLGMKVIGFDPNITVQRAWELSPEIMHAQNLNELLESSEYITLHVPLTQDTKHLLDSNRLLRLPKQAVILNFSRQAIVDETALLACFENQHIRYYISDFPSLSLINHPQVISLPHLGASTEEAEDNCAMMAIKQVKDFLEHGIIRHAVNFPDIEMKRSNRQRLIITNANIPNMVAQISTLLAKEKLNIVDLLNRSKEAIAISLIDVDGNISPSLLNAIQSIDGVLSARSII